MLSPVKRNIIIPFWQHSPNVVKHFWNYFGSKCFKRISTAQVVSFLTSTITLYRISRRDLLLWKRHMPVRRKMEKNSRCREPPAGTAEQSINWCGCADVIDETPKALQWIVFPLHTHFQTSVTWDAAKLVPVDPQFLSLPIGNYLIQTAFLYFFWDWFK